VSEETFQERNARLVPKPGDVLYSREGGILGIACIIPEGAEVCLGQRMMLLRSSERVAPQYLMHVLNSPATMDRVVSMTGGSSSPLLNVGDVKRFPVPVPPVDEQHEIVRRVEKLFALADAVEKRVAVARKQADALPQAILARAFSGELVPTEAELARQEGREYEPASVLLERIRQERAAQPATKVRRRRSVT
jgi:type I restriction enzyme, S subunit